MEFLYIWFCLRILSNLCWNKISIEVIYRKLNTSTWDGYGVYSLLFWCYICRYQWSMHILTLYAFFMPAVMFLNLSLLSRGTLLANSALLSFWQNIVSDDRIEIDHDVLDSRFSWLCFTWILARCYISEIFWVCS